MLSILNGRIRRRDYWVLYCPCPVIPNRKGAAFAAPFTAVECLKSGRHAEGNFPTVSTMPGFIIVRECDIPVNTGDEVVLGSGAELITVAASKVRIVVSGIGGEYQGRGDSIGNITIDFVELTSHRFVDRVTAADIAG